MRSHRLIAFSIVAFAVSTAAQNSTNPQTGVGVQSQTSASAGTTIQTSSQPSGTSQKPARETSAAASGSASGSSSTSASAGGNSASLAANTPLQANLLTTLDSKHNKPGDKVEAQTTRAVKKDGRVVLAKGTRLVGHVTQAQARDSANAESSLGVLFDNAVTKDGQQIPMHLAIQALATSTAETSAAAGAGESAMMSDSGSAMAGARSSGGGLVRGVGGTAGAVGNTASGIAGGAGQTVNGSLGSTTGAAASAAKGGTHGLDAAGQLTSTSSGVFGLEGLNLSSTANNSTGASVVTSASRNVHLDSGTQMVLSVMPN